ncbi:Phosphohistidine phosphatase, SixA [Syntrophobacter sp. SbD1]|nr:Phosphohistidine phosphatase, SixA [Syntrophobacter sp. SbD1]
MALFLVQHGKSLSKEQDPEQGLSVEGFADARRIAEVASMYGVRPEAVKHSGKKRARQTAEIFAGALLGETSKTGAISGIGPLDDVTAVANTLKTSDNLMLVGHLPFMERLTGFLITGVVDRVVFKFQNGGIVCLDKDQGGLWWYIKWALMPKIG